MNRLSTAGTGAGRRAGAGFTLIELLVAVAIVGILASIALASYTSQVARSRRADVQAALLQVAQYMQRYYAANNTYKDVTVGGKTVTPSLPASQTPPATSGVAAYNITIDAARTDTSYSLTATRSATGPMKADACGDFTYNQLDVKGLTNNAAGQTVQSCWR